MSDATTAKRVAEILEAVVQEARKLNPKIDVFVGRHGELFVEEDDERLEVNLYG